MHQNIITYLIYTDPHKNEDTAFKSRGLTIFFVLFKEYTIGCVRVKKNINNMNGICQLFNFMYNLNNMVIKCNLINYLNNLIANSL